MSAYYNEIDPFAAAWLRELIEAGLIADGDVDERSIEAVHPSDLVGFTQCHFFAGIGGWSYALRLAGWPDDRAVWTGSCPCQPFSSAGAKAGGHDPRDLWPVWFQLVKECRPSVVFGEQVEAAIGHGWLDRLCDDLEAEGYAVGAVGLPGPCVGAFDIRQRLWFVGESDGVQPEQSARSRARSGETESRWPCGESAGSGDLSSMADATDRCRSDQCVGARSDGQHVDAVAGAGVRDGRWPDAAGSGAVLGTNTGASRTRELADAGSPRGQRREDVSRPAGADPSLRVEETTDDQRGGGAGELGDSDIERETPIGGVSRRASAERCRSFWASADWIPCLDGKARPVEPGTFPLAHGVSARVGRLRGYGNAIKPPLAATFIQAYIEARGVK